MRPCPTPAKIPYQTLDDATAQMRHWKCTAKDNKKTINRMGVYHCPSGLHWHMGHDRLKRTRLDAPASIQPMVAPHKQT